MLFALWLVWWLGGLYFGIWVVRQEHDINLGLLIVLTGITIVLGPLFGILIMEDYMWKKIPFLSAIVIRKKE